MQDPHNKQLLLTGRSLDKSGHFHITTGGVPQREASCEYAAAAGVSRSAVVSVAGEPPRQVEARAVRLRAGVPMRTCGVEMPAGAEPLSNQRPKVRVR